MADMATTIADITELNATVATLARLRRLRARVEPDAVTSVTVGLDARIRRLELSTRRLTRLVYKPGRRARARLNRR